MRWYRANNADRIRETNRAYAKTDKCKEARKRYLQTDAGKLALKKGARKQFVRDVKSGAYANHILYGMTNKEIYG